MIMSNATDVETLGPHIPPTFNRMGLIKGRLVTVLVANRDLVFLPRHLERQASFSGGVTDAILFGYFLEHINAGKLHCKGVVISRDAQEDIFRPYQLEQVVNQSILVTRGRPGSHHCGSMLNVIVYQVTGQDHAQTLGFSDQLGVSSQPGEVTKRTRGNMGVA